MTNNRAWVVWQRMDNVVSNPPWRSPGRAIGALLLMLGMVLASSSVAEARDEPRPTGPLNLDARRCARETLRRRINGQREVVAKAETCVLLYDYDPLAENNEERDYAFAWVQARVEPHGAWCAKRVWSDLGVSRNTTIHKRVPATDLFLKSSRRVLVKIATTAKGFGQEKATLRERTRFYPRNVRHFRSRVNGTRIFTQRWVGQRGGVINLTSGAELSWEVGKFPTIASGLSYDFERRGTC
jgi:hypothetical protein